MPHRNAARVFPDPVGAQIKVFSPETIFGQPNACAGVGFSNDAWNQRLTGSLNGARGLDWPVWDRTTLNLPILGIARTRSEFEVRELIDAGDSVVKVLRQVGRGKGSGTPVEMTMGWLYTLRDGKVIRVSMFAVREQALAAARQAPERD